MQHNKHAVRQPHSHINVWDFRDPDAALRDWLQSIQAGDTVQIIPKARHPAWLNRVFKAEILLYGVQVRSANQEMLAYSSPTNSTTYQGVSHVAYLPKLRIYKKLQASQNEVRLVTIQPAATESPLSCSLSHASLDDNLHTRYECLSYCWGGLRDTKQVRLFCDATTGTPSAECMMAVTSNLYAALERLRNDSHSRTMWIDALCINQDDLQERTEQVSMMREIFAHASGVSVWLGCSSDSITRCIQDAQKIAQRYRDLLHDDTASADTTKMHAPLLDQGFYHVDAEIMSYEWFRRVWVLQEVFNATNISVMCGDTILSWAMILRINECLNRSMLVAHPLAKRVMPNLFAHLFTLDKSKQKDKDLIHSTRSQELDILDVLVRGLDLDATDPRDKVFALLSFAKETSELRQIDPMIRPDYGKSIARVFADLTRWWISINKSLRILSAIHLSVGRTWQRLSPVQGAIVTQKQSGRPSWSLWHDGRSVWTGGTLGLASSCPYSASGAHELDRNALRQTIDLMVLCLYGRSISKIQKINPFPYYSFINHIESRDHDMNCTCQEILDAYVALFDPIGYKGTWTSTLQQNDLRQYQRADDEQGIASKRQEHFIDHAQFDSRAGGYVVKDMAVGCHDPCFFHTPEGYRGLCPPMAQLGDMVVILEGGQVPYLLRPRLQTKTTDGDTTAFLNQQYTFIGECFLQGFMHGRAVDEQKDGHDCFPRQLFELV